MLPVPLEHLAPICAFYLTCILILFLYFNRYMVDAADHDKLEQTKNELHSLLEKPQLAGIPVSIILFIY